MCIDFDGHHSGGNSFVYVNDFCYYRNCCIPTSTSSTLIKNMLGYGQNIQSDWNINAAEFKIFYPLTH